MNYKFRPAAICVVIMMWASCISLYAKQNFELLDTVIIQPRSSWNAIPQLPYKEHKINKITIHHEGGKILEKDGDAKIRLKNIQKWCMGPDRGWTDIPYHLLIAPDGTVYQGRSIAYIGETNTNYNPEGHLLISFLGNYSQQELDENLLNVLTNLLTDMCLKYNISPNEISTHKDHSTQTTCPGEHIDRYFKNGYIINTVKQKTSERLKNNKSHVKP